MIEGGKIGWNFALRRMADRIHMVAMKDFIWEEVNGKWRTRWVPLGEGMVPFDEVFAILKNVPFPGPISLHIEYDLVGTSKSARLENALAAMDRDVKFIKSKLREAGRG
jgi:sugar phosphate isomerase/epimerase